MKKEFTINKPGTTDGPITILSKQGEPFNKAAKIEKYLSLGYEVREINGTLIKK